MKTLLFATMVVGLGCASDPVAFGSDPEEPWGTGGSSSSSSGVAGEGTAGAGSQGGAGGSAPEPTTGGQGGAGGSEPATGGQGGAGGSAGGSAGGQGTYDISCYRNGMTFHCGSNVNFSEIWWNDPVLGKISCSDSPTMALPCQAGDTCYLLSLTNSIYEGTCL